jgi:hypothetical protein
MIGTYNLGGVVVSGGTMACVGGNIGSTTPVTVNQGGTLVSQNSPPVVLSWAVEM